jgi:hypothetical protein
VLYDVEGDELLQGSEGFKLMYVEWSGSPKSAVPAELGINRTLA